MQTLETTEPQTQTLGLGFELAAGDLVWVKVKGCQWRPGIVYDPSEAPDGARKINRKDPSSILVGFWGDDGFAWCDSSRLKLFVDSFDEIVRSNSSKSFRAALAPALGEIGMYLEAQLSCNCLPQEERSGICKYLGKNVKISNCSAEEFVRLVRAVAVDASLVNALEIAKLRSSVVTFQRGSNAGYRRMAIEELVDEIDPDVSVEIVEGKEEGNEEGLVRRRVLRGPEISSEKSDRGRKKKSMAVLIAQMDLDSVEASDDDKEKKEIEKVLEVEKEKVDGVEEDEVGLSRRERKKSKYLSPPYAFPSSRSLVSPKSPKSPRALPFGSASTVVKCDTEELHKEEEEKSSSPLFQFNGIDVREVLFEFLASAVNPLDLKRNRLGKTVVGFFNEFRSSLYAKDAELVAEKGGSKSEGKKIEGKRERKRKDIDYSEGETLADKSEDGKKTEVKRGRKKKDMVNVEGETPINNSGESKKTEGKGGRKKKDIVNVEGETPSSNSGESKKTEGESRRKRKDIVNVEGETPSSNSGETKKTEGKRGRKRKVIVNVEAATLIDKSIEGKKNEGKRGRKKKDEVNTDGEIPVELSQQTADHSEEKDKAASKMKSMKEGGKRGRRKADAGQNINGNLNCETMNSKDGPIIDVPINLESKITNGSEEVKSKKKKKNIKNSTNHEEPAAILLTFSPGTTLPSKENIISAFNKYGPIIQSESELLKESNTAKIVFGKSPDAEKAFNDRSAALGLPVASYRLRYLTEKLSSPYIRKRPLPYIRKSLEKMISSLSGSAPETRDNLVGDIQGLLTKVDKMLTEPTTPGTSN